MQSLLWLTAAVASASTAATPTAAPAEPSLYRSAFETYRGWHVQESRDWKGLNDQMRQLGGHAGHLRDGADHAGGVTSSLPGAAKPSPAAQAAEVGSHRRHPATGDGKR